MGGHRMADGMRPKRLLGLLIVGRLGAAGSTISIIVPVDWRFLAEPPRMICLIRHL